MSGLKYYRTLSELTGKSPPDRVTRTLVESKINTAGGKGWEFLTFGYFFYCHFLVTGGLAAGGVYTIRLPIVPDIEPMAGIAFVLEQHRLHGETGWHDGTPRMVHYRLDNEGMAMVKWRHKRQGRYNHQADIFFKTRFSIIFWIAASSRGSLSISM